MGLELLFLILGLMIGSFLAAYSYRLPLGISVSKGRSYCPHCKKQIEWYDNIPVVSYLILKGKCRKCNSPISARYLLIEVSTALGFFALYKNANYDPLSLLFLLVIYCLLTLIFTIDFEHQIIPDKLVYFGIVITIIKMLVVDNRMIYEGLLSGFVAAVFLLVIHILTKGKGMGLGDVKFAILGGLLMGPKMTIVWLFLAFLTGAITGIILILGKFAKLKDKIAFGPFLVISLAATYIWGPYFYKFLFN